MSYYDFTTFLIENLNLFICIFFLSLFFIGCLFWKHYLSIWDPFTISVLASTAGFSVVHLLYIQEEIECYYYVHYLLTQIVFWVGFLWLNKKIQIKAVLHSSKIRYRYFRIYVLLICLYLLLNLIVYITAGIPIFAEYRLGAIGVGGGFGIITRALSIISIFVIYFTYYYLFSKNKFARRVAISSLVLILLVSFLSGAKSAFFNLLTILFLFYILNRDLCHKQLLFLKRYSLLILVGCFLAALVVIIVQTKGSMQNAFSSMLFRIVSYGDTYYMAYPNANIEYLTSEGWFGFIFGDFLRTIRVIPTNGYLGMGYELYDIANGTVGTLAGPNPRHNVIGYVSLGYWGSILFSFCGGFFLKLMRYKIFNYDSHSEYKKIFCIFFYKIAVGFETDAPRCFTDVTNFLLFVPLILCLDSLLNLNKKTHLSFVSLR